MGGSGNAIATRAYARTSVGIPEPTGTRGVGFPYACRTLRLRRRVSMWAAVRLAGLH